MSWYCSEKPVHGKSKGPRIQDYGVRRMLEKGKRVTYYLLGGICVRRGKTGDERQESFHPPNLDNIQNNRLLLRETNGNATAWPRENHSTVRELPGHGTERVRPFLATVFFPTRTRVTPHLTHENSFSKRGLRPLRSVASHSLRIHIAK